MIHPPISLKPYGNHALLVEWPNEVSEIILDSILDFEDFLRKDCLEEAEWETISAYNSLLLVNPSVEIDYENFESKIYEWYEQSKEAPKRPQLLWKLPVSYDVSFGIDLEEVSKNIGKSVEEVIELHTSNIYTVYGIGFLPGFMYLGGVHKDLETPRKATPRLKVAKGAVGIAGKQTGIYPQESPGGWNIIGNCPVPLFDKAKDDPCFVNVGDRIQFQQVSKGEHELHKIEAEVGIYKPEKVVLDA
ncbi:5-oxoprolinase subunit PxpB [Maribacter sp. PR1]|uniref:5-oxoprolinase subunit PxpB n=1 Tax=Maribacter cobaltidurans TaxID=1178778 RepID=A0ABU7IVM1_9FLAO|nr:MULTISPECIES: 5-oxoprolinase subunit PxpB [Maribacter]MDC6389633.1 5-oxoprolinase subunit PxpB [Maribacter sp. PR1]MEE1977022.1 5-oxoprolinase subunit PxpB [Maribacter cobaltidurans]